MKIFRCTVCGEVIFIGRTVEDFFDRWTCPTCGKKRDKLEKVPKR